MPPATCENRKAAVAEAGRRYREQHTQSLADVLRRRLLELRDDRGLSQPELAELMTAAGVPLTGPTISKIESGLRRVSLMETFAFAHVLEVPYAKLFTPPGGDKAVRITEQFALDHGEVANWMAWGPPWTPTAQGAQKRMRLTMEIAFWMQALEDASGEGDNSVYTGQITQLLKRLRAEVDMRPGVVRRRDAQLEAAAPDVGDED